MKDDRKRFNERFQTLFESEGLENVKFFVRRGASTKVSDFVADVNRMNDTIAAGDFAVVESIDGDCETKRFDAAF